MELCHCDLNRNLNELLRGVRGEQAAVVLGCGEVRPERKAEAERYARAPEAWLAAAPAAPGVADEHDVVSTLLGDKDGRKDALVRHLVARLRDNGYEIYAAGDEDFSTPEARIQHLEICCFNWKQNLVILLDEIGTGKRHHGWHGIGGFCACGDIDRNNSYPDIVRNRLHALDPADGTLLNNLRKRLEELYAEGRVAR